MVQSSNFRIGFRPGGLAFLSVAKAAHLERQLVHTVHQVTVGVLGIGQ